MSEQLRLGFPPKANREASSHCIRSRTRQEDTTTNAQLEIATDMDNKSGANNKDGKHGHNLRSHAVAASDAKQKVFKVKTESETANDDEDINPNDSIDNDDKNSYIKKYAETAMNELLGWYGYGSSTLNNAGGNKKEAKSLGNPKETCSNPSKSDPQCRPTSTVTNSNSESDESNSPKISDNCGWCNGKCLDESMTLSSGSAVFCSELCFSQSRRASFKKNKTCDWCKQVRNTISSVDFQDGASQLQFCSDKCLNQYKMHIFCRETRAHLEMHAHLGLPSALQTEESSAVLITPELWLKNCRSPRSTSKSPPPDGPSSTIVSPLPLIKVAPPSKLLASAQERIKRGRTKKLQKKSQNMNKNVDFAQDLRVRHSERRNSHEIPRERADVCRKKSQETLNSQENLNSRMNESLERDASSSTPLTSLFTNLPTLPNINYNYFENSRINSQSAFATQNFQRDALNLNALNLNYGTLPPITIMVPYPVTIPVPVPIPIPLPLTSFLQAAELKLKSSQKRHEENMQHGVEQNGSSTTNISNNESSPFKANGVDPPPKDSVSDDEEDEEIIVDDVRETVINQNIGNTASKSRKRERCLEKSADNVCKNLVNDNKSSKKATLSV